MKQLYLALLLLTVISAINVNAVNKVYIDTETQTLRTSAGSHLMLHGVNVIYKIWPYIPSQGKFDP
jgi:hypothetical protein